MSIVAVADGVTRDELLAAVAGAGGRDWPVEALATGPGEGQGWAVIAGAPWGRSGDWLVVGTPVRDPWGVPSGVSDVTAAAAAFERYGPAAVQLFAGPFAAVDLAYGKVVRAVNGIVPVHVSTQGSRVASTSAHVAAAFNKQARIGALAPGGSDPAVADQAGWGPIAPDPTGCEVPWAWVDRTVGERIAGLGALSPLGQPDLWGTAAGHALYLPSLAALGRAPDALARYASLRDDVLPRLWWRARLAGRWLFAPAFERPVLDTISLLRSGRPAREGPGTS